jgi:orotate phosphoribosyltransferase
VTDDREWLRASLRAAVERGEFRLSGGGVSTVYIDARRVTLSARGAAAIARLLLPRMRARSVRAAGGLSIGADPIAAAVAVESLRDGEPLDAFLVRKEPKPHGTRRLIEGPDLPAGTRVAVVDDVLTTGGSLLRAIEAVRGAGWSLVAAFVVVDRQEGGREEVERTGVPLDALFTVAEILGGEKS